MSRFVYKLFHEEKHVGDFTSINHILNAIEFPDELRKKIIKEFKVPAFVKRQPQVFEDNGNKIKILSDYLVYSGTIQR